MRIVRIVFVVVVVVVRVGRGPVEGTVASLALSAEFVPHPAIPEGVLNEKLDRMLHRSKEA